MKFSRYAFAILACLALIAPAAASAVPIHRHYTVHRPVVVPRPDERGKRAATVTVHKMKVVDVPPPPPPPPEPAPTVSTSYSVPSTAPTTTGSLSSIPGVPASFAACVAMAESTNGAGSSNIYGILPSTDPRGSGTLAEQQAAFAELYANLGTAPWAPYDGC